MNTLTEVLIAILNSLWQAALLAGLVWLALRFAPRMNAATRYAIWWAALGVVLILPAAPATIRAVRSWFEPKPLAVVERARPALPAPAVVPDAAPLILVQETSRATWPLWVAAIWGLALIYRSTQIVRSYFFLRGLKRRAEVSDEGLPATGRVAKLLLSDEIESPIAVGFAEPAVVLPASLPAEISASEMEHVLLHESAHLARRDDWTNLAARVLGGVLALHPVALWILRRIEIEREAACDDWVVARTQSARPYAESLARLYEWRLARRNPAQAGEVLASGIFGSGSRLGERIESLLRRRSVFSPSVSSSGAGSALLALAVLTATATYWPSWIAYAQTRPSFDVASIKRHEGERRGMTFAAREGGRLFVENNEIANVIQNAYGIAHYQLVGAPDWVNEDRFDIEARGASGAKREEMMLMVQSLLRDRFQFRAHIETRDQPAYLLAVAKGGSKLHLLGTENCVTPEPTNPSSASTSNACGNNRVQDAGTRDIWNATHISMPGVARSLTAVTERAVIDQTAIKGTFDVHLEWSDDLDGLSKPADAPPSLFVALRETLGLELKSGRGPVEVLVVDHIERPSEN